MNRRILIAVIAVALVLVAFWLWQQQPNERQTVNLPPPVQPVPVTPSSEAMMTRLTKPPVSEPVAPVTIAPPANAADLYREAFKQLAALSDEEKKLLADWKTDVDASELCAKLKPIIALANEAAEVTNCDWGIKNIGWNTLLPHLAPAKQLSRALIWNAAHCRADDQAGIGDDLAATLRVGQSISSQFLMGHLVNIAVEKIAMDYLTVNVGKLSGEELERLAESLGSNQHDEALHRGLQSEVDTWNQQAKQFATMSLEKIQNDEGLQQVLSDNGEKPVVPMGKTQMERNISNSSAGA
jgi:hypothetical protein